MSTTRIGHATTTHARLAILMAVLMSLLPGEGARAATATVTDIGKIAGSQQIVIPATNRAYEKPQATGGGTAADPLKEGYCRSALPVVFGDGAAEITGAVMQNGNALYAPATVGGTAVTLECTISNLNTVQKMVASYGAGPAFQDPNIRGLIKNQDLSGLYLPDPIRNQAKLDTYTALIADGQVSKVTLGFVAAAGWKLLDDAGLTLELKDITLAVDYETAKRSLGGTLGGSLIAGPAAAPVTFAVLGSIDKDPKNFAIVGSAEKIDFIAMMKAMAPKGAFGGLPVPIDALSQFARVDLAKLTVKPFAKDVNFFATTPLVGLEFSFKPNEVVPVVEEPPLSTYVTGGYGAATPASGFSTSLTGGYTGKAATPPPPPVEPKPAPKPTTQMGFMLGIEPAPGFRFAEIVPELAVIDRMKVVSGALVYSTFRGEAQPDTNLAVFKNWSPTVKIAPGFTALAVAEIDKLVAVLETMKFNAQAKAGIVAGIKSGLPVKNVVFMANVPKTPQDFKMKLLANLKTPRILTVLDFRDVDVELQPMSSAPAMALGGTVDLKLPNAITTSERLVFAGRVGYEAPTTGFVSMASKEDIKDVLGFKGLRIGKAALAAGLNFQADGIPIPDNMELTGGVGLTLNGRQVFRDVSATGAFDINDFKKLAIRFNVEQLDWKNFVIAFGGPKVFDKLPPAADRALNTELRDLRFQLAMPGMTFTSATGQSFTGMHVLGRGKIAGIAGDFDAMLEGFDKGFAISAAMDRLALPKVAGIDTLVLQSYDGKAGPQAAVNLTLANLIGGGEPLIRIDGDMILLGSQSRTAIVFAQDRFEGATQGKIYGVLDGALSFTTPSFANPLQEMQVKASLDTQALGAKITRKVLQGLTGVNFTLKEFSFAGTLGALKGGATAEVVLSVKPQNLAAFDHKMNVAIDVDGTPIVDGIANQIHDELAGLAKAGWKGVTQAAGVVADKASEVPAFLKIGWAKTGGALIKEVEDLFDGDDRKRIKVDGPKFRLYQRATNLLLRPQGIDGKSGASLVPSQGANAFEEEWQLVPSSEDGFHYLVTGWDGQNINVRGASKDDNAEIWIQQHKNKNKANEKIELVPAEGDWYFLRFKHSGKYVYGPGAGTRIVQSSRQDPGAMWRFEPTGIKVWDKSGPGSLAAAPADGVVVFVLENYQGNWLALHEGKNQLGAPFGNKVASVRLPAGYSATLFDKVDCSAKHLSLRISSSATNLRGSGLSGDVACVTVEKTTAAAAAAPPGPAVRLFLQPSYAGVSFDAVEGTYPLADPFRNKVRSVQVPATLTATLVNKIDCVSGGSLMLGSDTASLAGRKFALPNGKTGSGVENNAACVIVNRKAATAATAAPAPAPAPTSGPAPMPLAAPVPAAAPGVVELFVDKNYGGAVLKLAATGQPFALPDLYRNKVSSLRVPAGMSAELFDKVDCNMKNTHKVFTANTPSLDGTGLNDDVACVIVRTQAEPVPTY